MTSLRLPALALPMLALAACDEGARAPASLDPDPIVVTTREVAVTFPAIPSLTRVETQAAITHLADDEGVPVAATAEGLIAFEGAAPSPITVVAQAGEPLATGPVYAIARRDTGLLVSAEAGLFHTFEGVLLPSPASAALTGATALALARDGEREIVWAALPDGLHRLDDAAHERVVIPDEPGAPSAIAAIAEIVLVAFGERLYELDADDLAYRVVPAALGPIEHAASAGDRLFVGGPAGLLERRADGTYRLYATLTPVLALATDPYDIAYVRVPEGVLRLDPSDPVGLSPIRDPSAPYVGLALDRDGHLWLSEGAALLRLSTGRVVSFSADVAPTLEARCGACHADGDGAPRRDFADYDIALALSEAIFTRISTGLMPPPPSPPLTPEEYDLLVRWYAGERAP